MKVGATQSPGGGNLRQGVLRKELTWQLLTWRNYSKTSMSEESEQGMWGSWSPSNGQGTKSGMEVLDGPEQKRDVV